MFNPNREESTNFEESMTVDEHSHQPPGNPSPSFKFEAPQQPQPSSVANVNLANSMISLHQRQQFMIDQFQVVVDAVQGLSEERKAMQNTQKTMKANQATKSAQPRKANQAGQTAGAASSD